MTKEKVSIQEIAELLAAKASISKRAADEFLKVLFQTIEETLVIGEVVKIKNFGTFKLIWNEPRKSVNVQTGEEIMLEGFNKISFVPDSILRDLVNEPFSHLQAVQLDVNEVEEESVKPQVPETPDPLRNLAEQASEIKSLLFEIKTISEKNKATFESEIEKVVEDVEIPDYVFEDEQTVDSIIEEAHVTSENTSERFEENSILETKATEFPQNPETVNSQNPFIKDIKPKKRKYKTIRILSILFMLVLVFIGLYVFHPVVKENTNYSLATVENAVSNWISNLTRTPEVKTIVVPKDQIIPDSVSTLPEVDSLQILFDTPRVYPEFIATERIKKGSRLTLMAKRYYGTPDFWVYIYEANKDRIKHPDKISVRTLIYIPKIDARLIDASNPRCIKKAKELHDLYVK